MHLLVADYISTKYQMRENSMEAVVDALYALVSGKTATIYFLSIISIFTKGIRFI